MAIIAFAATLGFFQQGGEDKRSRSHPPLEFGRKVKK